jgi:YidC/Oxa1 family membrane protein insertase
MANSQKYMTYIMPFFALTGLYWPFGLVLYWCTTNIWTLGQQFILGRKYPYTPPAATTDGATATPGKAVGRGTATANALTSGAGRGQRGGGASTAKGGGSQRGPQGAKAPSGRASANGASASGSNGNGSNVLRRLSKGRSEPEPQPVEPEVKLVRHQTQRQSRAKRSGKR